LQLRSCLVVGRLSVVVTCVIPPDNAFEMPSAALVELKCDLTRAMDAAQARRGRSTTSTATITARR
jgi:hypothetical protein